MKKLQVLFLRSNQLDIQDLEVICNGLRNNSSVKILDVSANPALGKNGNACEILSQLIQTNHTIEYLGLSNIGLTSASVIPLF